jgi:outer membrane protein OmpA-like peptidoglycan-associated protein
VPESVAPLLQWLKNHKGAILSIEGHTDPRGREAYNVMLSYARALSVVNWLEREGADKKQMVALAAGATLPRHAALVIADNRMALLQVDSVPACAPEGSSSR